MERHLGGLGQGTDQHQHQGPLHEGTSPLTGEQVRPGGHDLGETVGAGRLTQHDQADQHGQSAEGGHDQRLDGGATGEDSVAGVADQQEGEHRGDLPEGVEDHQVISGDQTPHGASEGQQLRAEGGVARLMVGEVTGAVGQHQRTHAEHNQSHEGRERVQAEGQGDAQVRDPGEGLDQSCTLRGRGTGVDAVLGLDDGRELEEQPHESGSGGRGQDIESVALGPAEDRRCQQCHGEERDEHCQHRRPPNVAGRGGLVTVYRPRPTAWTDPFRSGPTSAFCEMLASHRRVCTSDRCPAPADHSTLGRSPVTGQSAGTCSGWGSRTRRSSSRPRNITTRMAGTMNRASPVSATAIEISAGARKDTARPVVA